MVCGRARWCPLPSVLKKLKKKKTVGPLRPTSSAIQPRSCLRGQRNGPAVLDSPLSMPGRGPYPRFDRAGLSDNFPALRRRSRWAAARSRYGIISTGSRTSFTSTTGRALTPSICASAGAPDLPTVMTITTSPFRVSSAPRCSRNWRCRRMLLHAFLRYYGDVGFSKPALQTASAIHDGQPCHTRRKS